MNSRTYQTQLQEAKLKQNNRNANVVTVDEIQRIKDQCFSSKEAEAEEAAKDKRALYMKSQARVKHWPNTIHALRQKRENDRIKRLED